MPSHQRHSKINYGFTLIELLVVISIIGLLSSVVMAGLQAARQKGSKAAAQRFYTHTRDGLYGDLVLNWSFDDGLPSGAIAAGSTAYDNSTLGRNGYICGSSGNLGAAGCSAPSVLQVSTSEDGAKSSGSSLRWAPAAGADYVISPYLGSMSAITLGAWVKPTSFVTNMGIFTTYVYDGSSGASVTGVHNRLAVRVNASGNITASNWCGSGGSPIVTSSAGLTLNEWNYVAVSLNGTGGPLQIFINGKMVGEATTACTDPFSSRYLTVGFYPLSSPVEFSGYIDEVSVWSKTLLSSEIEELYARGLSKVRFAFK